MKPSFQHGVGKFTHVVNMRSVWSMLGSLPSSFWRPSQGLCEAILISAKYPGTVPSYAVVKQQSARLVERRRLNSSRPLS